MRAFRPPPSAPLRLAIAPLLGLALACGDEPPAPAAVAPEAAAAPPASEIDTRLGLSRDADRALYESMRADMTGPRHPSDGGGRAWIEAIERADGSAVTLRAGDRARIRLVYEAGPHGVAVGGGVAFHVSPWWAWDPPQPLDPAQPGLTTVASSIPGLHLRVAWDGSHLRVTFPRQPLPPGGRLHYVYGAGAELAGVDVYAERGERLWFAVDGDGDGTWKNIADPPRVDIAAGPPERLRVVVPSTARPGERVTVRVAVLDRYGNAGAPFRGTVRLSAGEGLALPAEVAFEASHGGVRSVDARAAAAGVYRVTAGPTPGELPAEAIALSNPLLVETDAPRLYWADLHGHSQLSDGTGTPEAYFAYARDVAGLDAAALTDHDHWGLEFLDESPALWDAIRAATARFHAPGHFVTLLGYEWTSLLHGHRHVLYFEDEGAVHSAFDPRSQTPRQLWEVLRGEPALTFAHHSAGGPISTNWRYRPDPDLEPVTEVVSGHGNSESPDAPIPIYDAVAGNFVRDVLDEGVQLGFIGSGDSHDGHPGADHRERELGRGLAGIWSEALGREALHEALRARRVYATNGARIFVQASLDAAPMGSAIAASPPGADPVLRVRVVAESPLERLDLVRRGEVAVVPLDGGLEAALERPVAPLEPGGYLYVRVVQRDQGAAWTSPFFAQ